MCCQGNDSIVAVGFGPWSNASHSDTNMRESLQFSSRQILTQFKCIESKKKWQASGIKNTRSSWNQRKQILRNEKTSPELCKKVKANNCRYSGQYLLKQWTNKRISLDEFQWCYCTLSQLQGFVGSSFSKTTDYTLNVVAHVQDQIPSAPNHLCWHFFLLLSMQLIVERMCLRVVVEWKIITELAKNFAKDNVVYSIGNDLSLLKVISRGKEN